MHRKFKALGLTFVALLALAGLSSSAVAATPAEFHSEATHTIIDGAQPVAEDDVFTVKAGTVKCKSASYSGTTSSATTETVTVEPTYKECTAFGFVNTPIDTNGCKYAFNAGGSLKIECPAGSTITVTGFNCTVTVGSQTVASGVTYDNAGSGTSSDVTATANLSGLEYTQANKSFPNCTGGAGTFTDGKYVGSGTVTGTNTTGGAVGIWWTPAEP